jgi:hypothetical protein
VRHQRHTAWHCSRGCERTYGSDCVADHGRPRSPSIANAAHFRHSQRFQRTAARMHSIGDRRAWRRTAERAGRVVHRLARMRRRRCDWANACVLHAGCCMVPAAYIASSMMGLLQAAYLLLASLLEAALYDFARQEQQTLHCAQTNTDIRCNYGGLPEAQSLPTAGDRSQGPTRPDSNSAAHPGCRGLWLVKRQAAPDQQLNVGLARHTQMQATCRWIASKPNGLRLLQGACEPSRSMLPLRARATRVRRVPQPFRASKGSPLAAAPGAGGCEAPNGPAVLACRVRREEPRRKMQLADGTERGGTAAAYKV